MKTHGTQTVKEKTDERNGSKESENPQQDETDHLKDEGEHLTPNEDRVLTAFLTRIAPCPSDESELETIVEETCERLLLWYDMWSEGRSAELQKEIMNRCRLLLYYKDAAKRNRVLEAIVTNFLVRARKENPYETELLEM